MVRWHQLDPVKTITLHIWKREMEQIALPEIRDKMTEIMQITIQYGDQIRL